VWQQHVLEVEGGRDAGCTDRSQRSKRSGRPVASACRTSCAVLGRARTQPRRAQIGALLRDVHPVATAEHREQVARHVGEARLGEAPERPSGEQRPERATGVVGRGGREWKPGGVAGESGKVGVAGRVDAGVRVQQRDRRELVETSITIGGVPRHRLGAALVVAVVDAAPPPPQAPATPATTSRTRAPEDLSLIRTRAGGARGRTRAPRRRFRPPPCRVRAGAAR
jgi:hypothetical protein